MACHRHPEAARAQKQLLGTYIYMCICVCAWGWEAEAAAGCVFMYICVSQSLHNPPYPTPTKTGLLESRHGYRHPSVKEPLRALQELLDPLDPERPKAGKRCVWWICLAVVGCVDVHV